MTEVKYYTIIDGERQPIQSLEQKLPKVIEKLKNNLQAPTGFFVLEKEETEDGKPKNKKSIIISYPYVLTQKEANIWRQKHNLPKLHLEPRFENSGVILQPSGVYALLNKDRHVVVDVVDGHIRLVWPQSTINLDSKKAPKGKKQNQDFVTVDSPALRNFFGPEFGAKTRIG